MAAQADTTAFSDDQRESMLEEVKTYLPLFLKGGAAVCSQPLTDLEAITGLDEHDLRRVVSVHACLSEEVRAFIAALPDGLRRPTSAVDPAGEVAQTVRGPVDWEATQRARSASGNDPTTYVVRPGDRVRTTPENHALVWALQELDRRAGLALADVRDDGNQRTWRGDLLAARRAVRGAQQTAWLRALDPRRPDARTIANLSSARLPFYRHHLGPVLKRLLQADEPDPELLTQMLCDRYFVPERASELFELVMALRLTRKVEEVIGQPRRRRLLAGASSDEPYALYELSDGELELYYQRWPVGTAVSPRVAVAKRHGFRLGPSKPDFCVRRTGAASDCIAIEVKATTKADYLGQGLRELLAYLLEQPGLWGAEPAGWLVGPPSGTFSSHVAVPGEPLWIVDSAGVADAVVKRMALVPVADG